MKPEDYTPVKLFFYTLDDKVALVYRARGWVQTPSREGSGYIMAWNVREDGWPKPVTENPK